MELKDPETGVYNTDPYNMVGSNPYGEIVVNNSDSYSYNLNANLTLLFKIMKGLTLSVQEVTIMTMVLLIPSGRNWIHRVPSIVRVIPVHCTIIGKTQTT